MHVYNLADCGLIQRDFLDPAAEPLLQSDNLGGLDCLSLCSTRKCPWPQGAVQSIGGHMHVLWGREQGKCHRAQSKEPAWTFGGRQQCDREELAWEPKFPRSNPSSAPCLWITLSLSFHPSCAYCGLQKEELICDLYDLTMSITWWYCRTF